MVRRIQPQEALHVRAQALRWGLLPPQACLLPDDHLPTSFHLGFEDDSGLIAGVSTYYIEDMPGQHGHGYRLRQMGVLDSHRRRGIGEALLAQAATELRARRMDYLWCYARRIAYDFYVACGFAFVSGEYEIGDIGPHRTMFLPLRP